MRPGYNQLFYFIAAQLNFLACCRINHYMPFHQNASPLKVSGEIVIFKLPVEVVFPLLFKNQALATVLPNRYQAGWEVL